MVVFRVLIVIRVSKFVRSFGEYEIYSGEEGRRFEVARVA